MKMNAKKKNTMMVIRKEETPEINIEIDGCKIKELYKKNSRITDSK